MRQVRFFINAVTIIVGIAAGLSQSVTFMISLCLTVMVTAALFLWKSDSYALRHAALTLVITIGAVVYGFWTEQHNQTSLPPDSADHEATVSGMIVSPVQVDGDRVSFQFRAFEVSEAQGTVDERLQITIYLDSEDERNEVLTWRRGLELQLRGSLQIPGTARNFGDFDYRSYLRNQRIHWQLTVEGLQTVHKKSDGSLSSMKLFGHIDRLRGHLSLLVSDLYSERYAGFMQGLLIGDRSGLPQDLYDRFSDVGMTHVLAISGLHVGVFTAGCFGLLRLFRLTKERTCTFCMLLIPLYVVCTGASPSAIRAGLMAVLGLIALRNNRWKDSLRFIMIAAVAMLIWNPYYMYNVSFQLSFVVTGGLIMLVPRLTAMLKVRPVFISGSLAVTIAAQLFSFPLVIYYFHIVHVLSPLANLLLVPLVSVVILPVGMISFMLGVMHPILGQPAASFVSIIIEGLFRAVEWTSEQDALILSWSRVPIWWIAAYYGLLVVGLMVYPAIRRSDRVLFKRVAPVLLCGSMLAMMVYGYAGNHWNRIGVVSVLDVGQGDSVLIRTPHGKHILVDGGGTIRFSRDNQEWRTRRDPYEVGKDLLVPLIRRRGIHKLDAIVATHQDADHIGGLHAVVEHIPTDRILFNGTAKDSEHWHRLVRAALARDIPLIPVSSGMRWEVDEAATVTFLHPFQQPEQHQLPSESDQNEASVVFVLRMYESSFLLTGDIDSSVEKKILARLQAKTDVEEIADDTDTIRAASYVRPLDDRSIDVLKIAHHGSKYSTTLEWLKYWQPASGAVSVGGRNRYGHPSPEVLERLDRLNIGTYRTDLNGEIQYSVYPSKLQVRTKF